MTHPIKNVCENCGGTSFAYVTPNTQKEALVRVQIHPGQRLEFNAKTGLPVNVYICDDCGCLRLFALLDQSQ